MKTQYKAIKFFIVLVLGYVGYYLPISLMGLTNWVQTATTIGILSFVYVITFFLLYMIWTIIKTFFK